MNPQEIEHSSARNWVSSNVPDSNAAILLPPPRGLVCCLWSLPSSKSFGVTRNPKQEYMNFSSSLHWRGEGKSRSDIDRAPKLRLASRELVFRGSAE
jgi:hypothetical protein